MHRVLCMSLVLRSLVSPSLWITPVKISASGLMHVTGVTVTGVTFLMDNSREDQCHQVLCMSLELQSLVSPSLWITPVKISASGLIYVTVSPSLWITPVKISASGLCMSLVSPSLWITPVKISASGSYVCHWCHLPYG